MESIENYNVLLVHGAYESGKGIAENPGYEEAHKDTSFLGSAYLGKYDGDGRIVKWLSNKVLEEQDLGKERSPSNSYIYHWRSFTNPANNSINNAFELGYRTWNENVDGVSKYGKRRALVEEAQEVKAVYDSLKGQSALQIIRQNPDLYRQLASRYILIGHSMGGIVSREWIQNSDYYHGEVDKVITLDSPHEGTGALNLVLDLKNRETVLSQKLITSALTSILGLATISSGAVPKLMGILSATELFLVQWVDYSVVGPKILSGLDDYVETDPLVDYVDPLKKGKGHIDFLKHIEANDSLPMFRILGADSSITFTDPHKNVSELFDFFIPSEISTGMANFFSQLSESDDIFSPYAFSLASKANTIGLWASASAREQGSSLVSKSSGWAVGTNSLTSDMVDVKRARFNAAPTRDSEGWRIAAEATAVIASACLTADIALAWMKPAAVAANYAAIIGGSALIANTLISLLSEDLIDELSYSHQRPLYSNILDSLKANDGKNEISYNFSTLFGDTAYTPYLMEDFLYEKPFVNLALLDSATLDSLQRNSEVKLNRNCYYLGDRGNARCAVGLFAKSGDLNSAQKMLPVSAMRPLRFKSAADWSKVGVKVDRWEMVDGLAPDGKLAENSVPIRHVERYEVPAITVEDWIEKYSFVVDDLMPHRLRQIKMSFNYQEEIAWECDVTKDSEADNACTVYKRTGGGDWTKLRRERHPVRKNGIFDFEPRRYGYDNLLAIQKDNQNTVTISTVNKIGLSNTQRFYYLFKATENQLVPVWPMRDAVVNSVDNFEAYASVLDYQGFDVVDMRDSLWRLSGDATVSLGNSQTMDFLRVEGGGSIYRSEISQSGLAEGEHHWAIKVVTHNSAGEGDSSSVFDVPFFVDVTAPKFELSVDAGCVNPDSSMFVARFLWTDSASEPDIRAIRWTLEGECDGVGKCSGGSVELPSLYDVGAKNFAVSWDKVPPDVRKNLADGLYRVNATAIDYASPGRAAYDSAEALVNKIASNAVTSADWDVLDEFEFNRHDASVTFRVDHAAPELAFREVGGKAADPSAVSWHAVALGPDRNQDYIYVSGDSLLNISYSVKESLGGRDSALVRVVWNFVRYANPNSISGAKDSVRVVENDAADGSWTETFGMRLEDGDYVVRGTARDEAGNAKPLDFGKIVRIDRTPPKISGLVSTRLVYPDSAKDFSATISVSESGDVVSNRTGMRCRYRVSGGDADGLWRNISEDVLFADTVKFEMEASAVGRKNGKRYLEAACADAAGNVATRTDLFHVGYRYPEITSPVSDDSFLISENIAIMGIAPPASTDDERTTSFRLRYRYEDSSEWLTDKISVVSANRSDVANVSKTSQSAVGILGYLHNEGFPEGTRLVVELSVRGCEACEWRSDSTVITLDPPGADSALPAVVVELSSAGIVSGEDSLGIRLRLNGKSGGNYKFRVYAKDAKGTGIFDKSVDAVYENPYDGPPSDMNKAAGVWFYEEDGLYHLIWKGFPKTDSIAVYFDSGGFGRTCQTLGEMPLGKFNCTAEERSMKAFVPDSLGGYAAGHMELKMSMETDSVMYLFGASGHAVMESRTPFRVFAAASSYGSLQDVPVYFGSSEGKGFSFIPEGYSSSVSPWRTGWAVHPSSYSLDHVWNGLLPAGGYPAPGPVKIYAEVTENVSENPAVILLDTTVVLSHPEMEIALGKIDEFYLIDNSDPKECSGAADSGAVYSLGSLDIPFSLKYRDAFVSAYILNSDDDTVKVLKENLFVKANSREDVHSVIWDATDRDGVAVVPGTYRVLFVAFENGGKSARRTVSGTFPVSFRRMVPDADDGVNLFVAEAFDDGGKNRYIPIPDYLVRADVAAKYLPAEKRSGIVMDIEASGTQTIYGYEPARFSLGIKRHRKQLDLVAVTHFHGRLDEITGGTFSYCSEASHENVDFYNVHLLSFDSLNLGRSFNFSLDYGGKGRGFDGKNAPSGGTFDIAVLTLRDYESLLGSRTALGKDDFSAAKENAIWMLESLTLDSAGFRIPGKETGPIAYRHDGNGLGCDVEYEDGVMAKSCTYGDSGTTADYDPNKNLFEVTFVPHESGRFYYDKGAINSHCESSGDRRYRKFFMGVELKIPDSYWNAPFGMDNLVNRTIRYDHANKTIFGDGPDGYWRALESRYEETGDASYVGNGSYFDGEGWHTDHSYGLLTPYEVQRLPFLPASKLSGGLNTFLFADEDAGHMQPSYFDLKFYGPKTADDYYQVNVLGEALGDLADCDFSAGNMDVALGVALPRCQVSFTDLEDSVRTPLFGTAPVEFYVGRNKMWNTGKRTEIPFPAVIGFWKNEGEVSRDHCPEKFEYSGGSAGCYKYYAGGSKIHYYYGDFTEEGWAELYTDAGIMRNLVNSPADAWNPNDVSYLDTNLAKEGSKKIASGIPLRAKPADYADGRFFVPFDTLAKIRENKVLCGISLEDIHAAFEGGGWIQEDDTLYVDASDTLIKNRFYRNSREGANRIPTRTKSVTVPFGEFTRGLGPWMKDAVIDTAAVLHLDSTEHSHFRVSSGRDSSDLRVSYKDAGEITVARPKELIEIKGKLAAGQTYRLSYLKDGVYYGIGSPFTADTDGLQHIAWFDVNRLNGNTQLLLTWGNGNESKDLYYSAYNLYVGSPFKGGARNTVSSLFGEIDVSLPEGSLEEGTEVTVRTSEADDYNFSVYNDLPLAGPVIEVLPHHDFSGEGGYPRIQMTISRVEMEAKKVTPQTLRLYKVDFGSKELVPLTNSLYGYLNADGSPAGGNSADTFASCCASWDESRCYDGNWAYMLISAETKTFSVFAALDSVLAEAPNIGVEILPEIATTRERAVNVKGTSGFNLYVDDDSLWNDPFDGTPATRLPYTMDGNGYAKVSLPSRGGNIDTNFVFAVALASSENSDSIPEFAVKPAFARAFTVPAEFSCSIPRDPLWLGLDNGHLEFAAACSHPGYGIFSLYEAGGEVAEIRGGISDTIRYDDAGSKLAGGVYESRYVGVSSLGFDLQVGGPLVYTDSMRPAVLAWNVTDSVDVLDRVFIVAAKVSDGESGIARAFVSPMWNGEKLQGIGVLPNGDGEIRAVIRLNRRQLAECVGCRIRVEFRAEDFGHNFVTREFTSEALYPYPPEIVLWYPGYEGAGKMVHEFTETGHDLDLSVMSGPWKSDAGLYFGNAKDKAAGIGNVDFGEANAYTFEMRFKMGHTPGDSWRRIVGFDGTDGLRMELQVRGRSLRLVEGSDAWNAGEILPAEKSWTHVAVTVDSSSVNFYIAGELARSINISRSSVAGIAREFYGKFSLGAGDVPSLLGNVADVRMYVGALTAEQIYALSVPVSEDGGAAYIVVADLNGADYGENVSRKFSCSVANGRIFSANEDGAAVEVDVNVEHPAYYGVILYVRSMDASSARISVGESGSFRSGTVDVQSTWRAVNLSGVSLPLSKGLHRLTLRLPSGLELGGVALADRDVRASAIDWGSVNGGSAAASESRKIRTFVRYEGYPETSTLRPRIRMANSSDEPVDGFSVRYYFRGEDPAFVRAGAYYPAKDSAKLSVHAESAGLGFAEWKFDGVSIAPKAFAFDGGGLHFGLFNYDYSPWVSEDDPSFVWTGTGSVPDADGFYENAGIVVLDADENLIGGSCAEMEDEISLSTKLRILARDSRGDARASEIHLRLENLGTVYLKNFDIRYYFRIESGLQPVLEVLNDYRHSEISLENIGGTHWQVNVHCDTSIAAGTAWKDAVRFALHVKNWESLWDASDDPSHVGLSGEYAENENVCVFDSLGNLVYGKKPEWTADTAVSADSGGADSGYSADDYAFPVTRLENGLTVVMDGDAYLKLDLVNATGIRLSTLFDGAVSSGERFVPVDWTGVNMNATYLMLRVNGMTVSTKLLSRL